MVSLELLQDFLEKEEGARIPAPEIRWTAGSKLPDLPKSISSMAHCCRLLCDTD